VTTQTSEKQGFVSLLQEYSIPLIVGVVLAVLLANIIGEHDYHQIVEWAPFGADFSLFGHHVTFHWLINDVFMVFFFGIAAKEITEAMLPGGALNPPSKAINPLFGTVGGVLGPVAVYFALTFVFYSGEEASAVASGWGIPTATDIALAWLVARVVFGSQHPAVNFLLLLAIVDDAIGLIIIAVFYPDPIHPAEPVWMLMVVGGMLVAYGMRRVGVKHWVPYIAIAGVISWIGFLNANLHPALALVPIVPFLPAGRKDEGLFVEEEDYEEQDHAHNTLDNFEHSLKAFVDFGLLFFGITNAGVAFASFSPVTIIVLLALIVGKTIGIGGLAILANKLGFKYPDGMGARHTIVAGVIAGVGLTVALFVAGEAFPTAGGGSHGKAHGGDGHGEVAAVEEGHGDEQGHASEHSEEVAAADEEAHADGETAHGESAEHGGDADKGGQSEGEIDKSQFQGPAKMGALLSAIAALLAIILGRMLKVKELEK
jgi:NhaA family Na+:H+ antiporter